jgi:hypothetical protein
MENIGKVGIRRLALVALAFIFLPLGASAQAWTTDAKTTSGRLIVERPTLLSLGFEWMIDGDSNNNAKVDVEYRKTGETQWHKALPMFRLHEQPMGGGGGGGEEGGGGGGRGAAPTNGDSLPPGGAVALAGIAARGHGPLYGTPYKVPNAFASSVLNLQPDTEYETRFTLSDPDGVTGEAVKTATVRTRKEPMPTAGGKVYHVYPSDYKGTMQEPSFIGLLRAYYTNVSNGDVNNSYAARVQPGDTILVHAGLYKDEAFHFYGSDVNNGQFYGMEFDGTYYLRKSGTPDKPIVIKGAGDGEAIFDGNGTTVLFDLMGASNIYFEGLTFRNAEGRNSSDRAVLQ